VLLVNIRHPARPRSTIRSAAQPPLRLYSRRLMLRPLVPGDFAEWSEVRIRNETWLTKWEPQRQPGFADPTRDERAFASRCTARDRDRAAGSAYPFGVFVDGVFAGELNINNVIRGALQSATLGYWIDQRLAGQGYIPEAVVTVFRFAFEELMLHRLEICIVPRNTNSRRVMSKLAIREEGVAERYLEIDGTWEDHVRHGFTAEEWERRRDELVSTWLSP
jgi:ribosomal-protein-alanine N-acetyltransferase